MPRVNNRISLSIVHGSRAEKYEDKESVGNGELSPLTAELDSVRNSIHETNKGSTSGRTSCYLDQAWKWLRTAYNGQSSVENSGNEEGTELQEILTEGETLRRQTWSLRYPVDEKPVASAWKGSFLKRCLVGVGILTGGCVLGGAGYRYYAGRQASTTGPEGNVTRPAPSGSSVKPDAPQPGSGGTLNEDFAFPEAIAPPMWR